MEIFDKQKAAFAANPMPSFASRMDGLAKLYDAIVKHEEAVVAAISADFGHRSAFETRMAETSFVLNEIKHTRRYLRRWMKRERRSVALHFMPASAYVEFQPKGVVGILSPWNYPFQLVMAPLVSAFAAGNCVMLKPSEFTPKTNAVIGQIISEAFEPNRVAMVEGEADVAAKFSSLPFDHLFFTGSARIGQYVLAAAAKNLTPTTLELGGKSPVIIGANYNIKSAAMRIMVGKLLNAGQTCIAPDYVLVPKAHKAELVQALLKSGRKLYPNIMQNDEYSAIINDHQYERLNTVLEYAEQDGAKTHKLYDQPDINGKMMPTILDNVTATMRVMQSEIFGPILPIIAYDDLNQAIEFVAGGDNPLAAYYFSHDNDELTKLNDYILCGNVTINDTLYHIAQVDLPFGGVGQSGMGTYHGRDGFKTFSHMKGVFKQARLNGVGFLKPPYSKIARQIVNWIS